MEPILVDFKIPETNCTIPGEPVKYRDCIEVNKTKMTDSMNCEVLWTNNCEAISTRKCKTIEYKECFETPTEKCHDVNITIPWQHYEHKKKCLLTEDSESGKPKVLIPLV